MAKTCETCGTRLQGTEHITGRDALVRVFYPGKDGVEQNVHTHPELESIAERAGVKSLTLRFDERGDLAEVHCAEDVIVDCRHCCGTGKVAELRMPSSPLIECEECQGSGKVQRRAVA